MNDEGGDQLLTVVQHTFPLENHDKVSAQQQRER